MSLQVIVSFCISSSVFFHVFFARLLSQWPWRFHLFDAVARLSLWPIQFHFRHIFVTCKMDIFLCWVNWLECYWWCEDAGAGYKVTGSCTDSNTSAVRHATARTQRICNYPRTCELPHRWGCSCKVLTWQRLIILVYSHQCDCTVEGQLFVTLL